MADHKTLLWKEGTGVDMLEENAVATAMLIDRPGLLRRKDHNKVDDPVVIVSFETRYGEGPQAMRGSNTMGAMTPDHARHFAAMLELAADDAERQAASLNYTVPEDPS